MDGTRMKRDASDRTPEERIDQYVKTFSARDLAGMLVELEDKLADMLDVPARSAP